LQQQQSTVVLRDQKSQTFMLRRKIVKEKEWLDLTQNFESLKTMVANATQFVREIEKGNLDVILEDTVTASDLSTSLISMRDRSAAG
jgi:hypothetical protein